MIKSLIWRIWTTNRVTLLDRLSCTYFFFRCTVHMCDAVD